MLTEKVRQTILSDKPTDEQEEAIFSKDEAYVLRACPGSGKTWTAARRMAWRLANWDYSVGGLALLSFTNAAVEQFEKTMSQSGFGSLLREPHYVGTLDSFVEKFLLGPFGHLIMRCITRPQLFIGPSKVDWIRKDFRVFDSSNKRELKVWDLLPSILQGRATFRYRKGKHSTNYVEIPKSDCAKQLLRFAHEGRYTHEQRNFWAYVLLDKYPALLDLIARRFPEIIVDECQDTSSCQQAILSLLRDAGSKVTFIGDPDQCIFEFNQARTGLMEELVSQEGMIEKSLTLNRRSNDSIVKAVRGFGNVSEMGSCFPPVQVGHGAFVCRYEEADIRDLPARFCRLLSVLNLPREKATVVARGHTTIRKMAGRTNFEGLQGITKCFADAAYFRDIQRDFKKAYESALLGIKRLADGFDDWDAIESDPLAPDSMAIRLQVWKFVRSKDGPPNIALSGQEWLTSLKHNVKQLLEELEIPEPEAIGRQLNLRGMSCKELALVEQILNERVGIRIKTIHQTKGETLDAIMLVAEKRFIDKVLRHRVSTSPPEDVRLAYVAMTRPKHLLVIALPDVHFDKHIDTWRAFGFDLCNL